MPPPHVLEKERAERQAMHDAKEALERIRNAAPDLLDALEALVATQYGPPVIWEEEDWKKAMDAARAAIKKARGERHGKDMATIG